MSRIGENRNIYRGFVGTLEGKGPLRKSRRRLDDNIKIHV